MATAKYNVNALKSEIRAAIINHKVRKPRRDHQQLKVVCLIMPPTPTPR